MKLNISMFCCLFAMLNFAIAEKLPEIPIGLDAYRQWERWPQQRIGVRAYMRSTYDRSGGNHAADASHFLYQLADDKNVTLDVRGPGILYFARYNHWHGSPWHYEVDGVDHIVQETSSADPTKPKENSVFLPEKIFPNPLTWTWSLTKGADLMWVPIAFEKSFRMAYSRTHYGTGYYIYHQFVEGTKLSQPLRSWDGKTPPADDVLELISRSGTDLLPKMDSAEARRMKLKERSGALRISANETKTILQLDEAPSMIRALNFSVPREQAIEFGRAKLRVTWDDLPHASIEAPVALFFGAGTLYNRDNREFLVKAFPVNIRFDEQRVHLACYFPMPFFRSAKIELINTNDVSFPDVQWSVRFAPYREPAWQVGYFHATFRDFPKPEPGKDLVLLDTTKVEGGGDWSGNFIGTSWIFSDSAVLNTLEGDPRFFFDDSESPQAYGTGTEEWGGGGDYWGGRNMTLPFAGHPCGARDLKSAKNDEDKIQSAYRFLLADLMPFGKNARIQLEHGGENNSTEHYQTVTYWYGANKPTLVKTDELKIGDAQSESQHDYNSPSASEPYEIISRYELGVDTLKGKEIFPAQRDVGRKIKVLPSSTRQSPTGVSEFNLKLDPKNVGVMLRRKLDYQFPNQCAEVFIAKVKNGKVGRFKSAGTWYLAGGNTCVYSNPKDELGATEHIVETSNRRFRDDEFLLPKKLTEGREQIRVRIKFTPVKIPLFPGHALPELAWSEIRYDAYCFVLPK